MEENIGQGKVCVVIGASHAGVNFAFALRREGWQGEIILFDADPELPYHRPPLSKAYLLGDDTLDDHLLKPEESYQRENITLNLGVRVSGINPGTKTLNLENGNSQSYDKLVIATGARPLIPPIKGIEEGDRIFPIRTAKDSEEIKKSILPAEGKKVVVIGGGYIGLEAAASLKKLGAKVVVLERESRILARVTAPETSQFFDELHTENKVDILTDKNVVSIEHSDAGATVVCADGSHFHADLIIVGVGIKVNMELAKNAGMAIENGIKVDAAARTNIKDVYAIGDCTFHHNPHYDRFIRLESVQNAVDQAKVAAADICDKNPIYNSIPWFWSDQYDVKLQMVGLSEGYDQALVRKEQEGNKCMSVWYFKGDTLLAVDAMNNAKAYVLGTKFIKTGQKLDKIKLADASEPLKPANIILE